MRNEATEVAADDYVPVRAPVRIEIRLDRFRTRKAVRIEVLALIDNSPRCIDGVPEHVIIHIVSELHLGIKDEEFCVVGKLV